MRLVLSSFLGMWNGRTYGCTYMNPTRPAFPPYAAGELSDHVSGAAFNNMLLRVGDPIGQVLADWCVKHFAELRIKVRPVLGLALVPRSSHASFAVRYLQPPHLRGRGVVAISRLHPARGPRARVAAAKGGPGPYRGRHYDCACWRRLPARHQHGRSGGAPRWQPHHHQARGQETAAASSAPPPPRLNHNIHASRHCVLHYGANHYPCRRFRRRVA